MKFLTYHYIKFYSKNQGPNKNSPANGLFSRSLGHPPPRGRSHASARRRPETCPKWQGRRYSNRLGLEPGKTHQNSSIPFGVIKKLSYNGYFIVLESLPSALLPRHNASSRLLVALAMPLHTRPPLSVCAPQHLLLAVHLRQAV